MTFAEFITKHGAHTIASGAGVDVTLVAVWKTRNRIPRERWPALLFALDRMKVDDFFAMHYESELKRNQPSDVKARA